MGLREYVRGDSFHYARVPRGSRALTAQRCEAAVRDYARGVMQEEGADVAREGSKVEEPVCFVEFYVSKVHTRQGALRSSNDFEFSNLAFVTSAAVASLQQTWPPSSFF